MKQFNQIVQFLPFYRTQLHFGALWEKQPNIEIQCTPEPTMSVCVLWRLIGRYDSDSRGQKILDGDPTAFLALKCIQKLSQKMIEVIKR